MLHSKAKRVLQALAVVAGVFIAFVAQKWESRESVLSNIVGFFILPYMDVGKVCHLPLEHQVKHLNLMRGSRRPLPRFPTRLIFGDDIADAAFGPNATRIININIPYSSSQQLDISNNQSVPVTCAYPHDIALASTASESTPSGEKKLRPLVLHFHGGGMIMGSVASDILSARYISYKTSAIVCSIGYRLAPEHPFPAAMDDAITASLALIGINPGVGGSDDPSSNNYAHVRSVITDALDVEIDITKVATFGNSAGGYMAGHTARLLAHNGFSPKVQVSIVPMAKPYSGTNSFIRYFHKAMVWNGIWNTYAWSVFLPKDDNGSLAADWRVSLTVDPPADVIDRLPLTYIQIASRDILRDEGEMYALRLKAQGKLIELAEYDTHHAGIHPFLAGRGPGAEAFRRAVSVLKEHLFKE